MAKSKNISVQINTDFKVMREAFARITPSILAAMGTGLKSNAQQLGRLVNNLENETDRWAEVAEIMNTNTLGPRSLKTVLGDLDDHFSMLNKQRAKMNLVEHMSGDIDRLYSMLQWIGAHISTPELKRMGLVPADVPDDTPCDVDWFLRAIADRADKYKAADRRLRGKKAEPDPGMISDLTAEEMNYILQMRKQGIEPQRIRAEIMKTRSKNP